MTGVGVDGNEKIRLFLVRDRSTCLQRNESIVAPGEDDFGSQAGFQQLAETLADIEHQILLQQTIRADGPSVMPPMAWINHDLANP